MLQQYFNSSDISKMILDPFATIQNSEASR